ncbi:BREX-1 system adenine-specific DNA-methyltransferase PglX [Clostridium botulinum]|uniref:BREX-1 system adenine-specific DNA-methyltransferase PglX n=1 Tax=Clostridium botulinum TaxID=1491 RepID=UPI0007730D75|nr:BREX-1 system adenine-specific DNA-methyltransferase PglX [Clostridium botulinum]MBY6930670.1 BREX-1 system adenine-specific DNA-methyltransferase PglX [Clostridium botulinum]NFG21860.1 BREX-1 system adenine-specific DNA-methyltransferase PglX [Clostridium botulinum]NFO79743.1 BREX-1 system adenine-specific DNA-methyltransferase PglX [Clostridium botulinum]
MSETLNKTLLKKFAVDARNELRDKISLKASLYGITKAASDKYRETKDEKSFIKNEEIVIDFNNQKRTLSKEEASQRTALIDKIKMINKEGRDGFNEIIEEVSYTWFNRFVALRYMEVNGYLQSRVMVLASRDGSNTPEIITEAMNVNLPIDKNLVYELKRDNKIEELYSYLVELQCSELNKSLPFMFEELGHYEELLFPAGVMSSKFFRTLVDTENITEEAWSNVEIIGWLYQYYISEEKDRVIKAKKKYKKNEIPFATQLFTPDWIVRYMVQNSLGRYWIESHKEDEELKENWEFYLENPEKEPDFDEKIAPYLNKELEVEDIKCFDPACGSGHILVYMFDVLHEIYSRCGYSRGDIPMLIIEKNLYGLDIDKRAYQLACFAVIMKGMSYDKLLLRKIEREVDKEGNYIKLNIACIQETNILYEDENSSLHDNIAFLAGEESGEIYDKVKAFVESLKNANTYGSLTIVEGFDKEFLEKRLEEIKNTPGIDLFGSKAREKWELILEDLIKQAYIMEQTYDILVTNPPYMGSKYMNSILIEFINDNYENTKSDLFSAFIYYCMKKVKINGQLGFLTPFVWMYISSYEKLREYIVKNKNISSLIELEYNAFPEACVPVCTFTIRNYNVDLSGEYIKLTDFTGSKNQPIKTLEAIKDPTLKYRYRNLSSNFCSITGMPIAYWATRKIINCFKFKECFGKIAPPKKGLDTNGESALYFRKWFEVEINKIYLNNSGNFNKYKWFEIDIGGGFRRWYGNRIEIINYEDSGKILKTKKNKANIRNESLYFKHSITYGVISSKNISFRESYDTSIFYQHGANCFPSNVNLLYILGLSNSKVINVLAKCLAPTLSFTVGDIAKLPIKFTNDEKKLYIESLVQENIDISKKDWDLFESSFDFVKHPLLEDKEDNRIVSAFLSFSNTAKQKFNKLKQNEKVLNEIFIELYGLQDEITPEVEEKDITIRKADKERDIKSFISYAIGCMFGRYSLDKEGLIFAGGQFDINEYSKFIPDEDNIIPVLNSETKYFEDDVMVRFEEFLKVTFSEEYLSENIDFIAEAIGKKSNESSREAIRRCFANEFFGEHCKMYKKRPIYWLFTSGKNKAFSCLVYMHRIDKNLLSKMRIDYVQPLQNKLEVEQKDLMDTLNSDATTKDKKDAKKKLTLIEKQIDELKVFHEKLRHMADKQIEIDLDDGVIHNHGLFGDLVAKIK